MNKFLFLSFIALFSLTSQASWYWPFGSDEEEKKEPRLSELMEPASRLIDEASDLAADGKVNEAVEKYREALEEIDKIEAENPERSKKPEFASLKTKRAYIGAAIDSMLLQQARENARAVAVSDTTELEAKLAEERGKKAAKPDKEKAEEEREVETLATIEKDERAPEELPEVKEASAEADRAAKRAEVKEKLRAKRKGKKGGASARPLTKREAVMKAIAEKNFDKANELIAELLNEKPNDAAALNLRAAKETAEGNYKAAEKTLDQAIQSNPRDPYAYYNMAVLYLQAHPNNKSGARRYYETARTYGVPADPELEEELE